MGQFGNFAGMGGGGFSNLDFNRLQSTGFNLANFPSLPAVSFILFCACGSCMHQRNSVLLPGVVPAGHLTTAGEPNSGSRVDFAVSVHFTDSYVEQQ